MKWLVIKIINSMLVSSKPRVAPRKPWPIFFPFFMMTNYFEDMIENISAKNIFPSTSESNNLIKIKYHG